jgi:cytochrome oxidase Cu insertion factor (SCO1/SenC/PrrC family)
VSARGVKLALAAAVVVAAGAAPATQRLYEVDPAGLRRAQFMEALMWGHASVGGPFALRDQAGQRRELAEFKGRLVLLYFGYTFCPDVCPTDLAALREVLQQHSDDVRVLFVTLDPERDTPAQLGAYLAHFDARIIGLTGNAREVRAVADRYKAYYTRVPLKGSHGYLIDHSAGIYLVDREGVYRGNFPSGISAELIARVLREFL